MADSRVSLVRVSLKFTALTLQSSFLRLSRVPEADSVVQLAVFPLVWRYFLGFSLLPTLRAADSRKCYSSLNFRPFWETKDSPESPCSELSNVLLGGLLSFAVRPWQIQNLSPYTQNLRISISPSDFVQSGKERVR